LTCSQLESDEVISSRRITADERRHYESGRYRIEEPIMRNECFHLEESVYRRISRMAGEAGVPATDLAGELLTRGMDELEAATTAEHAADLG
jgi:hypothetical protein